MIRLLQLLFLGHVHKWKTIDEGPLTVRDERQRPVSSGTRYVQQCERCGIVVKRDLA